MSTFSSIIDTFAQGTGPQSSTSTDPATFNVGRVNVLRGKLLETIQDGIPESSIHRGKKLIKVTSLGVQDGSSPPGNVRLSFEDNTHADVDAVVGADGIHSVLRKTILGEACPTLLPRYAGFWWTSRVMSLEDASRAMSPIKANESGMFLSLWALLRPDPL